MSDGEQQVWPGGMPKVGQVAERSRKVESSAPPRSAKAAWGRCIGRET